MPSRSLIAASAALSLLLARAAAQTGAIGVCNSGTCDYCPNSLVQQGTGYPACVIYNRDDVLGAKKDDYPVNGAIYNLFFDIPAVENPTCRTIIRTPANVDVPGCGFPRYAGTGDACTSVETHPTIMVQFCCGTGDCTAAGASRRDLGGSSMSAVLRDSEGNMIVPHAVWANGVDIMDQFLGDHGLNLSSVVQTISDAGVAVFKPLEAITSPVVRAAAPEVLPEPEENTAAPVITKRDCDTFIQDGGEYTTVGPQSFRISQDFCGADAGVSYTRSVSVSHTTSFSTTVGDPFGIVSASVGFETTEEVSNDVTYTFGASETRCGYVAFTPYYLCVKGTIEGCEGGPQSGDVCTPKTIDGAPDGISAFVSTV